MEELFKMMAVGKKVELYDERNPELARLFGAPSLVVAASEPAGQ